ncbi:hypothetical protein J2T09_001242 [Neorhizobium huautlense]|uniref:Uncharacterized protein n=1 Tax=Neorhizobium huautlense TaxID=67774 RepID=A0ABT9PPV0_9HYPH|nr:hypothetical protein [Neorhizobium huautlense]MDP9836498.1 hypothetical protein [Neorhizobium huautlense]
MALNDRARIILDDLTIISPAAFLAREVVSVEITAPAQNRRNVIDALSRASDAGLSPIKGLVLMQSASGARNSTWRTHEAAMLRFFHHRLNR